MLSGRALGASWNRCAYLTGEADPRRQLGCTAVVRAAGPVPPPPVSCRQLPTTRDVDQKKKCGRAIFAAEY